MIKNKFYITTTLPYVNANPHIGFAAEILRADFIARYNRFLGKEVFFNTGADEHGQKIYQNAKNVGIDAQKYCDEYANKFKDLKKALNLSYNSFTRTTDNNHKKAAQEFWNKCKENGDIYKKNYKVKYCVGCELEKTESELINNECPFHLGKPLEIRAEENYFFRWSAYQDKLLKFYDENPNFILPHHRMNEIKAFIKTGLQDFSISRLKEKMPWGIPVPDDDNHVMYVWFDALVNYISCLGWPNNNSNMEFWPGIQVAGKDNLRQQTAMWQAMLMSAGVANSTQVLIFGFINIEGQKMSKSIGNVVNPYDLVKKYGIDATRYYLLSGLSTFEDSDFTYKKFEIKYNSDLANGIGNLVNRVTAMAANTFGNVPKIEINKDSDIFKFINNLIKKYKKEISQMNIDKVSIHVFELVSYLDKEINNSKPWKAIKEGKIDNNLKISFYNWLESIRIMALLIYPFMPGTSKKILKRLGINNETYSNFDKSTKFGSLPFGSEIKKGDSLFPRL